MIRRPALFAAVATAHLLAACATTEPQVEIRTVEVKIPVPVSCVPRALPAPPAYEVTREVLLAAPDPGTRLALAVAGFLEREARLFEVEPVVEGCRTPEEPKQ